MASRRKVVITIPPLDTDLPPALDVRVEPDQDDGDSLPFRGGGVARAGRHGSAAGFADEDPFEAMDDDAVDGLLGALGFAIDEA